MPAGAMTTCFVTRNDMETLESLLNDQAQKKLLDQYPMISHRSKSDFQHYASRSSKQMTEKNFILTNKYQFHPDGSSLATLEMEKARSRIRIAANPKTE